MDMFEVTNGGTDDAVSELFLKNLCRGKLTERFKELASVRPELVKDGWVTGSLVTTEDGSTYICVYATCSHKTFINNTTATMYEVVPESVGRYIRRLDANGKKIFTGDILQKKYDSDYRGVVEWDYERAAYKINSAGRSLFDIQYIERYWKVIGNIYDNDDILTTTYDKHLW